MRLSQVALLGYVLATCEAVVPLPPGWEDAPTFASLPHTPSGVALVDPWVYGQRLGVYKELISRSDAVAPCVFRGAAPSEENVLWGLPLQLGWQSQTGRLFNSSQGLDSPISPKSWWAGMNYQLALVPLLGAKLANLSALPSFQVLPPDGAGATAFCIDETNTTDTTQGCGAVAGALLAWKSYFSSLADVQARCVAGKETRDALLDETITTLWVAHTASLHEGMLLQFVQNQLVYIAAEEGNFGTSWANLVEFLAFARFNPDFNGTGNLQTLLPLRMLRSGDVAPDIADLPNATNFGIEMIEDLSAANTVSGGALLTAWRWAMCAPTARQEARELIAHGLTDPSLLLPGVLKIIEDAVLMPRDPGCE